MRPTNQCQFAGDVVEKDCECAQVERTSHIQQTESKADGSDKEQNPGDWPRTGLCDVSEQEGQNCTDSCEVPDRPFPSDLYVELEQVDVDLVLLPQTRVVGELGFRPAPSPPVSERTFFLERQDPPNPGRAPCTPTFSKGRRIGHDHHPPFEGPERTATRTAKRDRVSPRTSNRRNSRAARLFGSGPMRDLL